ncbi:hypothetical protein [Demequina aurantiaca]|uniref:hypothetical protein n=1 Tax=Demequina aurantiaca TaxID=676200 RepID=UPI003D32F341
MDVDDALLDEIAQRCEAVLAGTEPRFESYAWAVTMTLADDSATFGPLVTDGLLFLGELTLVETRPGRIERVEMLSHWQEWAVTDRAVRDWFVQWSNAVAEHRESRVAAADGSDDPDLWMEIDQIGRDVLGDEDPGT